MLASTSSLNLKITRALRAGGVLAHSGQASFALRTVSLTRFLSAKGTMPIFSPVAGLKILPDRLILEFIGTPLTQ